MRGVYINEWIIRIVCMIVAWIVGKESKLKKWQIVVGIYCIDLVIGFILGFIPFSFNPENYILVILLLLCQMTIRTSLYEEVEICNLKKGMILSSIVGKEYMLTAKVYEALKSDVEYTRDKTVQYIKAKNMILEYLQTNDQITSAKIQEMCGFTKQQARSVIDKMRSEKLINLNGKGPAARYVIFDGLSDN